VLVYRYLRIVFVSHRWLGANGLHPDDAAGTKAKALLQFGQWLSGQRGVGEVAFWIDYTSIDQDNTGDGLAALPLYMATSRCIVCYETDDFERRAWCRLERLMAVSVSGNGHEPYVIRAGKLRERFRLTPLQYCLFTLELQWQSRGTRRILQGRKLETHG
jgi:hypothetical protein